MLPLLFYQGSMPVSQVLEADFTSTVVIDADLTGDDSDFLGALLTSSVSMTAELRATEELSQRPGPPRHYIWVYDLTGNRVDAIV